MQVSPSPAAHLLHVLLIYYSSTKPSINLHLLHMLHLLDLLQLLQLCACTNHLLHLLLICIYYAY